ncbi:MAG TPA: hypothetical protein PKD16_01420 [Saprospiraceae bacterium]|jgi:hypothetical protein|nr:hypothetical protein [Saprospiraceae bacterium]
MNPIRKKIKHLIPSYQFGGDTNFFDYFKSIVPKIKSYQGQTNGESNLYSDDSQKYYANLLRVNNLAVNNLLDIPNSTAKYTDRGTQREQVNGVSQNILDDPNSTSIRDILDANYGELNTVYGNGRNDPSKPGEYYEKYQPKKNAALTGFYSDLDKQRTNQMLETGANIFSLMKGQETYDNKPKESFDTTNTGSFGYRFQFGGNNNNSSYDQILKNIELDAAIKSLPVTKLVSANDRNKKIYDKAGDQLISDINYVFKDKKARAKADPMLQYLAESGVAKKLEKLDNKDVSYVKDTVNKTGFFSLGNIGEYKDLYKYIKSETGLTSEDAKGILDKAIEKESWVKRAAIKTAIKPFLQYGGKLDQQSNTVFNSLKSKGYLENFDTNSFNRLSKEEQDILFKKAALDFNSKQKIPQGEIIQEIRTPLIAQIDSSNMSADQGNFEQQFAKARKEGLVEFEYNGKKIAVKLNPNSKKSIVLSEKPNYKVDNSSIIGYAKDILANKQYGGSFVNKTGYTPGTESYNNPFNIIPGNDITMSQTPFPVLAKPNVGKPVVMIPGRDYKFPGASSVTEIPYKQFGGISANNIEQVYKVANQMNQIASNPNTNGLNDFVERLNGIAANNNVKPIPNRYNQDELAEMIYTSIDSNANMNPNDVQYRRDKMGAELNLQVKPITGFKLAKGGTQKVAEYQQMLKDSGFNITVDGAWGKNTQAAYEIFTGKKAPSKTAIKEGKAKVASNISKSNNLLAPIPFKQMIF